MTSQFTLGRLLSRLPFDLSPRLCADPSHGRDGMRRYGRQREGIRLDNEWYCSAACFERAMVARVRNLRDQGFRRRIKHRIPLGLMLLSAGAITSSQLAEALSIQRATGAGRLGELLCKSGITEEYDIAKAISGQWGCPVLKSCSPTLDAARLLPLELLERYRVIPFFYSSDQKTMYLAFAEGIEYPLMSAVERTLGCRTEACLVTPSELDRALNQLRTVSATSGAVFEQPQTDLEIAATVRSYALQCGATAVCVSNCGEHIWIRIFTTQPLDLLFRIS